jgi:hypothetical protein
MSQENVEEVDDPLRRCYKHPMRGVRVVAVAVALAVLGPFGVASGKTAKPTPRTPPTLSGESFHQDAPTITSIDCKQHNNFSYSATGRATGPYPGTFTERGTMTGTEHSASFTINSSVGHVTGTKAGSSGISCTQVSCFGVADCQRAMEGGAGAAFGYTDGREVGVYQATITTANGTFLDNGEFGIYFYRVLSSPLNGFDESFRSGLAAPVPLRPTSKEQCKNGGWRDFGFKNQGQCIRFVKHGPRNREAAGLRE